MIKPTQCKICLIGNFECYKTHDLPTKKDNFQLTRNLENISKK